jgi:DNA polymerase-3 subunit alpha
MLVPIHIHSHQGSILDSVIKIDELVDYCVELGYTSCPLTDHGSLASAHQFIKSCESKGIKPIIGNEIYVCKQHSSIKNEENRKLEHMVLLAKNKSGYFNLVKLTSAANSYDSFYYKPRLSLNELVPFKGSLIAFTGHPGSIVGNILCGDNLLSCVNIEDGSKLITDDIMTAAREKLIEIKNIFGDDLYLEIQLFDSERCPGFICLANALRQLGKELDIKCIACIDAHYVKQEDAEIQRIALCSSLKMKMKDVTDKLRHGEDVPMGGFFKSDQYYIHTLDNLLRCGNTQEEIGNLKLIEDQTESYSLEHKPRLPQFSYEEDDYDLLVRKCREGWKRRLTNTWDKKLYGDRVKMELRTIRRTKLASYFLILADCINFMKERGYLIGSGRGSSAGSLVCYLLGITEVDPIKHNLIFERFMNPARSYSKHVSFEEYKYLEDFINEK